MPKAKRIKIKKTEKKREKPSFASASAKASADKKATAVPSEALSDSEERRGEGKEKKVTKEKKVKKVKKVTAKIETKKPPERPEKYWEAVGRRKTAVARIRLFSKGEKEILVNDKPYQKYFPDVELSQVASASLQKMNALERFRVVARVRGGGLSAQAEAIRHGTARALVEFNPDFRRRLKKSGFLTRDSRMRERKKFGLKRARRAPQWKKR